MILRGGVHGADEWGDLESLQSTTEVYAHTICILWGKSCHNANGLPFYGFSLGIRWAESTYLHSRHSGRGHPRRDQQSSLLT